MCFYHAFAMRKLAVPDWPLGGVVDLCYTKQAKSRLLVYILVAYSKLHYRFKDTAVFLIKMIENFFRRLYIRTKIDTIS